MGTLDPKRVEEIVTGLARGCRRVGCALMKGDEAAAVERALVESRHACYRVGQVLPGPREVRLTA